MLKFFTATICTLLAQSAVAQGIISSDTDKPWGLMSQMIIAGPVQQPVIQPPVTSNIAAAIQLLGAEFCMYGDTMSIDDCSVPIEADEYDPRVTVTKTRAWTMDQLLRSRADEVAALARMDVLRLSISEEQLRAELLELESKNHQVPTSAELLSNLDALHALDQAIMTLEDDVIQNADFAADLDQSIQELERQHERLLAAVCTDWDSRPSPNISYEAVCNQ